MQTAQVTETPSPFVVAGLDNGGTSNNATLLDATGAFLVDDLVEVPSRVQDGPDAAVEALVEALHEVLRVTGVPLTAVRAVGLDTPGPASATGVTANVRPATTAATPRRAFGWSTSQLPGVS